MKILILSENTNNIKNKLFNCLHSTSSGNILKIFNIKLHYGINANNCFSFLFSKPFILSIK